MEENEQVDMGLIKNILRFEEGYKEVTYLDTEGILTGGIGHKITPTDRQHYPELNKKGAPINQVMIAAWFGSDSTACVSAARKWIGPDSFDSLSNVRRAVFSCMAFQLGRTGIAGFKQTLALIQEKDWPAVAKHMLDSLWYRQTPKRAARMAWMVEHDTVHPLYHGQNA